MQRVAGAPGTFPLAAQSAVAPTGIFTQLPRRACLPLLGHKTVEEPILTKGTSMARPGQLGQHMHCSGTQCMQAADPLGRGPPPHTLQLPRLRAPCLCQLVEGNFELLSQTGIYHTSGQGQVEG